MARSALGTFVRFFSIGYSLGHLLGDRKTALRTGLMMGAVAVIGERTLLDREPSPAAGRRVPIVD